MSGAPDAAGSQNKSANWSITRRLLIYIAIPLIILVSLSAALAAFAAKRSVSNLYDEQLQRSAEVLLAFIVAESSEDEYRHTGSDDDESDDDDEPAEELLEAVADIEIEHGLPVNFRLKINNRTLFTSKLVTAFAECAPGFTRFELTVVGIEEDDWHCFREERKLVDSTRTVSVEVFENAVQRERDIRSLIIATFSPLFLLPIAVLLLTYWAISRAMRSLRSVSSAVATRSVSNLKRLPTNSQPQELLPVISSVNGLLDSIERSLLREKRFTDDAAHELRTPLTSIKMLEQLLRRDNQDQKLTGYLDNLRDSVSQSDALIDQLLGFARLQSVKSMNMQSADMRVLLHTQFSLLSRQLTAKNLEIDMRVDTYSGATTLNEPAISLLLNNVVSNAIKFSPESATITVILTDAHLSIEDDGPGIDMAERSKVFERFYRSQGTQQTPGSGLGLAIVKWVADAHNFQVRVEDAQFRNGARLTIEFKSS